MSDDRLIERLRQVDPATADLVARASHGTDELRRAIMTEQVDELEIRRRSRRHRITVAIAAAAVTAALLVPLFMLLPLGDDGTSSVGTVPSAVTPTPTGPAQTAEPPVQPGPRGPIEVEQPTRDAAVTSPVTISGTADVFEATVSIRILDAVNNPIAETFTTATCGTGCRGDFSIDVPYSVDTEQPGVIQVFEVSAMDGSMQHVVRIPVTLMPTTEDPIATAIEGAWRDANGTLVPDGQSGGRPLVLATSEGAEHCGWTSVTFLTMGWPPGSEMTDRGGSFRQYLRDPMGVLGDRSAGSFEPDAALPDDAADTGSHRGDWHLRVAPSDSARAVYLVEGTPGTGGVIERWPRAVDPFFCD